MILGTIHVSGGGGLGKRMKLYGESCEFRERGWGLGRGRRCNVLGVWGSISQVGDSHVRCASV